MRKLGEKVLVLIWNFLCDSVECFYLLFKVALKPSKKFSLKVRAVCSGIATGILAAVILKLLHGSFIMSGILYGFASIQKHLGILLASDGDWTHWMSGGRYLVFKEVKDTLIKSDNFAKLLNFLAGKGLFFKILQLGLILLCFACMCYLCYLFYKCFKNCLFSIRALIRKKNSNGGSGSNGSNRNNNGNGNSNIVNINTRFKKSVKTTNKKISKISNY